VAVIPNGVDAQNPVLLKAELKAQHFVYQGGLRLRRMEALLRAPEMNRYPLRDGPTPSLKPFTAQNMGILWLGFVADENRRIEILRGRRVYSAFFGGRTVAIFVRSDGLWSFQATWARMEKC